MINLILTRLLGSVGKRLDGYKTKIGGAGFILMGVLGIMRIMFPDLSQLPDLTLEASLGLISAGITALGLGGKTEKQTTAIREQTAAVVEGNRLIAETAARTINIIQPGATPIEKLQPSDG